MPCAKFIFCLPGWLVVFVCCPAAADSPESPFVAGFERFGRHQEISELTAGVLLASELNCTSCHVLEVAQLSPKRGPRLTGVGNRIHPAWIKRFLASPHETKPGATMPDLFTGWQSNDKKEAIEALSAFLSTQREDFPVLKASGLLAVPFEFWNKGEPERGRQLYHQVGCVACHEPDKTYETADVKPSPVDQLLEQLTPEELQEMGLSGKARRVESIPHSDLAAKYTRQSLTFFLLDPAKTRPALRMPDMKLQPVEAADIAAYLLRNQKQATEIPEAHSTADLSEKGKTLFSELRCINCHDAAGIKEKHPAKPWHQLNRKSETGCLSKPEKGIPAYRLDEAQTAALTAALTGWEEVRSPNPATVLEHWLLKYNCLACHERGGLGGVGRFRKPYFETAGHVDLGDEGRLPPPLDHAGRKLARDRLKKALLGNAEQRPFIKARMPKYSNFEVTLVGIFAGADGAGLEVPGDAKVFGNLKGLASVGRDLVNQGCVECHSFRGEALPGVVGVDLAGATERLRPDWFHAFLKDPASLKARTRMPTFFPGGQSQNKTVLDGDPDRQIAAMWAYLKELDKQKLPAKIAEARAKDYELKPTDRPIVLRTFMKDAGTHAIAVGFQEKVHFAFDAEACRPAIAWRGKFLDAEGTWFSRFTPPANPLGEDLISLPDGLPFALLKDSSAPWPKLDPLNPGYQYRGYRLDADGVPTFLYRYDRFEIADRIEPAGKNTLNRSLTITDGKPIGGEAVHLSFRPISGKTITFKGDWDFKNDEGLTVKVLKGLKQGGEHRERNGLSEWILPLDIKKQRTIELEYQW